MSTITAKVKTLRQVDRIKATAVGQTFELSLTKGYVSRWGLAEAVRELIQNALDSDSPFKYEFRQVNRGESSESWVLVLQSEFTTLTPQTLLLGHTSKQGQSKIGSFGEGYKLALLVLTRLGYDVDMFNGDVLWRPRFRFSRRFQEELLVVDESFLSDKTNKGLTVMVWGLSVEDKEAITASCVRMQDRVGAIKQTSLGDILVDQPKKLYVGDLYICDTEMKFGYNIRPAHIALERDRQTVDSWDLGSVTAKMWLETGESRKVAEMLAEGVPDVQHVGYNATEVLQEECYRLFRENYPNALIASSPEEVRKKVKEGLTEYVYVGGGSGFYSGGGFYGAVSGSRSYREDVASRPQVPKPPTPEEQMDSFWSAFGPKRETTHSELVSQHMSEEAWKAFDVLRRKSQQWRLV